MMGRGKLTWDNSKTVPLIFLKALDIFQPLAVGQLLEGLPLALFALRPDGNGRWVWHIHGLRHVASQGFGVVGHAVKPAIGGFLPAGFKVCQLAVKEQIFQVVLQKCFVMQAAVPAAATPPA